MARNDLQERRVARGLKQREVEAATGVQQPVLSMWEAGRVPHAVRHALSLARFYGVTVEELFAAELLDEDEDDVAPRSQGSGRHPAARSQGDRPSLTGTEG
jgi:transcriptional regulator with XRE-family HTH domain